MPENNENLDGAKNTPEDFFSKMVRTEKEEEKDYFCSKCGQKIILKDCPYGKWVKHQESTEFECVFPWSETLWGDDSPDCNDCPIMNMCDACKDLCIVNYEWLKNKF